MRRPESYREPAGEIARNSEGANEIDIHSPADGVLREEILRARSAAWRGPVHGQAYLPAKYATDSLHVGDA